MSLRTRLLALFLLVAVVPLLALGGVEYARSLRALEAMIAAQNARVADRVAASVRGRAALMQSDLHLLAKNAETQRWLLGLGEGTNDPEAVHEADRFLRDAWARMGSSYGAVSYTDSRQRELYRIGAVASVDGSGELLQPVSLTIAHPNSRTSLGTVTLLPALAAIFSNDTLRVASFVSLSSPPWTVVVSGAVDEFSGPFTEVRRWTLALFLVVAIGATGSTWRIPWSVRVAARFR